MSSETSSTKRKRKAIEWSNQDDKLIEKATSVLELLGNPIVLSVGDKVIVELLQLVLGKLADGDFSEAILEVLNLRFPVIDGDAQTQAVMGLVNYYLNELSTLYQSRLESANAIPPPSQYARHSIWAEWQEKDTAILCFRPSDKHGLPLCVLDNVFREFQRQMRAPLPSTEDARKAMNVAFDLCDTMPNHFATESDRGNAFDECLDPIFPRLWWRKEVCMSASTELHAGKAGRTYELDGVVRILREDKVETGTGDDAYMQVSRVYQLYVENLRKEKPSLIEQGAPVFLLCVLGPMLLICGGFYDKESTIVEPLVEPCLMFNDCLHLRQEALARQLFALKQALVTLCSRSSVDGDTANHHPAGVPRVYTTYTTEDNTERSLTVLRPLKRGLPQSLLFIAAEDPLDSSTNKLVKLVVREYGVGVHRLLAERQFAPMLYGQRFLEGAPTAYIMEFLSPPTYTASGWVTLFEFFKSKDLARRYSRAIRVALDRILTVMEEANMVHGDLRSNNVMLEVGMNKTPVCSGEEQGVNLRVVDFDWAGEADKVCYPLQRNEAITWPGDAGTPIIVGHDRVMVNNWMS